MEKALLVLFLVLFGVLFGSFLIVIGIEYFCFCTKPAGADKAQSEAQSEAQTETQAEVSFPVIHPQLEVLVIPHQLQVPVIPHQLQVPKSRGTQPRSYHQLEVIPEFPYLTPKVKLFPAMQKGIRNKEMVDVTPQLRLWELERAAAERESALEAAAEREAALEAEWERQAECDMEAEWERQAEWDMEAEWDVEAQEEGKVSSVKDMELERFMEARREAINLARHASDRIANNH